MPARFDWQQPNNTEGAAWQLLGLPSSDPAAAVRYVPFPWASWIDAVQRGLCPPEPPLQLRPGRLRVTVCQHIRALDHLEAFAAAGITDLFWSHTPRHRRFAGGLRLHPFPLFPVRCSDHPLTGPLQPASERPWLYTYLGFHQPELYGQDTRLWLLDLPPRADALVGARSEWHFEQQVYRQQVHGQPADSATLERLAQEAADYVEALQISCFALCPSGAGPNTIRLWESLGFGAIPVILADALQLPGPLSLWRQAALFVPEQPADIRRLPEQLAGLRRQRGTLQRMQAAGRRLWRCYGLPGFVTDVRRFLATPEAVLVARAEEHLQQGVLVAAGAARPRIDRLNCEDPALMPLQVRRWCRSGGNQAALLVCLQDRRPLEEQMLRWRGAVQLCRDLIAAHPGRRWSLCSQVPGLERLAAADGEPWP